MFGFPFLAILASQLSSIFFTRSLHAHLLVHLMTSWISRMLRMSSLRILSRRVSDAS